MHSVSARYYQTITYTPCNQNIYQQDITIHRSTGTNYEEVSGGVNIWHVFVGQNCRSDYGDLRFTDGIGSELTYYLWPNYTSEIARFCVKLVGASVMGMIGIWYGDENATTTSNGNTTFFIFDDFENGTSPNPNIWTWTGTAPSIVDGNLRLTRGNTYLTSIAPIGASEVWVQYEYTQLSSSSNSGYSMYGITTTPPVSGVFFYPDGNYDRYIGKNGSFTWWSSSSAGRGTVSLTQVISVGLLVDRILHRSEGAYTFTDISMGNTGVVATQQIRINPPDNVGGGVSKIGWIIVRAYSSNPPSVIAFSGEQHTSHTRRKSPSFGTFGSTSVMVI